MDAATFETLFQREVVGPAQVAGFDRWGKGLWFQRDGLRAAVLRTESRNTWPFRLTLTVGHDCLRDFDDRCPAPRSTIVSEWPVKIEPSRARTLIDGSWRYVAYNLGSWPGDVMIDASVAIQLGEIGAALSDTFPILVGKLSPQRLLEEIRTNGEGAWCEQRWLDDYERA